jgi:hypothetical protein
VLLVEWFLMFQRNIRKCEASDAVSHLRRLESQNIRILSIRCFSQSGWSVVSRSGKMGRVTLVFIGVHVQVWVCVCVRVFVYMPV